MPEAKNWTDWQMQVPVISTVHMPSSDPDFGNEYVWTPVSEAGGHVTFMVLIEELDEDAPEWLIKLIEAMRKKGFAPHWVRFDDGAPVIDGIPTYRWGKW